MNHPWWRKGAKANPLADNAAVLMGRAHGPQRSGTSCAAPGLPGRRSAAVVAAAPAPAMAPAPMTAAVAAASMAATSMAAAVAGPVGAVARAVNVGVAVDMDIPVDVDILVDVDVAIDGDVAMDMAVPMVPAMPSGRAAPADAAIPRKAAPVPAWAAPARSVPAVVAATPDELGLFDGRAFDERGRRRKCANVHRGLGGQDELRDESRRDGKGQGELAKHGSVLRKARLSKAPFEHQMNGGARDFSPLARPRYRAEARHAIGLRRPGKLVA